MSFTIPIFLFNAVGTNSTSDRSFPRVKAEAEVIHLTGDDDEDDISGTSIDDSARNASVEQLAPDGEDGLPVRHTRTRKRKINYPQDPPTSATLPATSATLPAERMRSHTFTKAQVAHEDDAAYNTQEDDAATDRDDEILQDAPRINKKKKKKNEKIPRFTAPCRV